MELGLDKNTLFLFFSDNGDSPDTATGHPAHRGHKGSVYEGGTRVPAIAWWPGKIKANTKTDQLAVGMDLLPTFAELAGIKIPEDRKLDGLSLCELLLDGNDLPRRQVFFGYEPKLGTAMRDGDWKMIVKGDRVELYNLSNDVGEKNNLVNDQPTRAKAMRARISRWKNEVAWNPNDGK